MDWLEALYEREGGPEFSLAELYHERSKVFSFSSELFFPELSKIEGGANKLYLGKRYSTSIKVDLPLPAPRTSKSYEEIVASRPPARQFSGSFVSLKALSYLLKNAYGVTGSTDLHVDGKKYLYPLRAVPAIGAIYSAEIYVAALRVKGLKNGLYHYDGFRHQLELMKTGNFAGFLKSCFDPKDLLKKSALVLLITGVFTRKARQYGERGYRFALLEAGFLGQSICRSAAGLNLGVTAVETFVDDLLNEWMEVDGVNEAVLLPMIVGDKP